MADLEQTRENAENIFPANSTNARNLVLNVNNSSATNTVSNSATNTVRPAMNSNTVSNSATNTVRPAMNSNTVSNSATNTVRPPTNTNTTVIANQPLDINDYIQIKHPYSDDEIRKMKAFFKGRSKNTEMYSYTADGNLLTKSKSGVEESTLNLKTYVNHDKVVYSEMEQMRLDFIGEAEYEYENAFKYLRDAKEKYDITGEKRPLLLAQLQMAEADQLLSRVRYRVRNTQSLPNPSIKDIVFDQPNEDRKLFPNNDPFNKELVRLIVNEVPYTEFYGKYVDSEDAEQSLDADSQFNDAPTTSESSARQVMKNGKYARVFYESNDGPNGFLSPFFPVEFTYENTKYFTGLQAYETMRAQEAGKADIKAQLLKTRSTRTMRYLTRSITVDPKNPKEAWLNIFTAIYQQHPELKDKLLKTETDTLVFADIRKGPSGTGIGERDAGILTQSRWLYENAVGSALESLRYQLREGIAKESSKISKPLNSVISTDEQSAAKVAAIINAKKKFQFKKS
jgi:predicted NAD-dependent protein-ADP-ribosyltransferase YbiA (DUF1768 family)